MQGDASMKTADQLGRAVESAFRSHQGNGQSPKEIHSTNAAETGISVEIVPAAKNEPWNGRPDRATASLMPAALTSNSISSHKYSPFWGLLSIS
jgi:hypothetical protein